MRQRPGAVFGVYFSDVVAMWWVAGLGLREVFGVHGGCWGGLF